MPEEGKKAPGRAGQPKLPAISDAELVVMKVVWKQSPVTANEVVEALAQETKWKPKTIQTLLSRLALKGALAFEKKGREYLFRPRIRAEDFAHAASRSFLRRVFDGEVAPFLACFLEREKLSPAEIEELRRILDGEEIMNLRAINEVFEAGFNWTWKTSLEAAVLIALVLVVQTVFRKMLAPRWRYALGLLILARLAMPALPSSSLSIFNLWKNPPSKPVIAVEAARPVVLETALSVPRPEMPETPVTTVVDKLPRKAPVSLLPLIKYLWLAGCLTVVAMVVRQHWKLAVEIRRKKPVTDPRITGLLEDCMAMLGVKRRIGIVITDSLNAPALFGGWRPCLLLPGNLLEKLDDTELRLVFLHELIHLRHGDIWVNWLAILLRSAHWFNPAVWLAFRRLRNDQELACDAAVLTRLAVPERRVYGDTLIKLAGEFSSARFCPTLAPFITRKNFIKRRIIMIAEFKRPGRLAVIGSVGLLLVLACLTFTRAADAREKVARAKQEQSDIAASIEKYQREYVRGTNSAEIRAQTNQTQAVRDLAGQAELLKARTSEITNQTQAIQGVAEQLKARRESLTQIRDDDYNLLLAQQIAQAASDQRARGSQAGIDATSKELAILNAEIKKRASEVDELRRSLGVDDSDYASDPSGPIAIERVVHYNSDRIEMEKMYTTERTMLDQLTKLETNELRETLPRVYRDPLLSSVLQDKLAAETALVKLKAGGVGPDHPERKATEASIADLNAKLDAAVAGSLAVIKTKVAMYKAGVEAAEKAMNDARREIVGTPARTRPYWVAKAELDQLKQRRDELALHIFQEQGDSKVPRNDTPSNAQPELTVSIWNDGSIHVRKGIGAVSLEDFKKWLGTETEKNGAHSIVISTEKSAPAGQLTRVIDAARENQMIQTITFMTAPIRKPLF